MSATLREAVDRIVGGGYTLSIYRKFGDDRYYFQPTTAPDMEPRMFQELQVVMVALEVAYAQLDGVNTEGGHA